MYIHKKKNDDLRFFSYNNYNYFYNLYTKLIKKKILLCGERKKKK